jgi:hypothetical protein
MASYGFASYRQNGFASYEFIKVCNNERVEPEDENPFAPKALPMSSE